jgi:formylglycine-generating enzyme required for sulfatase activity
MILAAILSAPARAFDCDPSASPQPNLGLREEPGLDGCPPGMARVREFCIDRFEGNLEVRETDGGWSPWSPFHNPGANRVRAVSLRGAVPQGYISGFQADAACHESGKRLCRDDEWLYACRGGENLVYPYGPDRKPGLCNDARDVHPALELFPHDPHPFSHLGNACLNQLPNSLDRTGSRPECVTRDGVYDLMGNVHEWTADPAGTFRGGYYVDTYRNGNGCLYVTTAHSFAYWDYSTGFRCCADPLN